MGVDLSNGEPTRRARVVVAVGAALFVLFALPAFGAQRDLGEVVAVDETDCEPSPAELEDITFTAEQEGIPLDEALARYGWQSCFVEVTSYLTENYPSEYAGAAIVEDGRGAWIAFKADIPDEVAGLVDAIPVTVELIGGRGFSEAELNEVLQSVYANISTDEEVVASNGSYDIETGVITIQVQPSESLNQSEQREQLRTRLLPEPPANAAISVDVVVVDELGGGADESSDVSQRLMLPLLIALLVAALLALAVTMVRRRSRPAPDSEDTAHGSDSIIVQGRHID